MRLSSFQSKLLFGVAMLAYVILRGVFEARMKSVTTNVRRHESGERWLLAVLFVGTLLLPLLFLFTTWLWWADYALPGWCPWLGLLLLAAALWLFWRSHVDLGQNWSRTLEIRATHELVTRGVYRSIRHPMYAAIWLFSLGQGLMLENWLAGWAALGAFAVLYFVRVPREEQMMGEHFGLAYRAYQARTGRLFPRVRRPH